MRLSNGIITSSIDDVSVGSRASEATKAVSVRRSTFLAISSAQAAVTEVRRKNRESGWLGTYLLAVIRSFPHGSLVDRFLQIWLRLYRVRRPVSPLLSS
ncbi:hypothetical protein WUBG_01876 [Wuchereria bancrofti]|uniref:Uncharacterized protein n=1 Tax=Wuchereria bancrofti TaxID=6293 RepID=J9FC97_WUCBA|nr:hypothetical protein WUBG_01876 [Wuchereria bancrofti]